MFAWQRRNDPLGLRFHVALAAGLALCLALPMTVLEVAGAPLLACFLVRWRWTWPMVNRLGQQLVPKLVMAWAVWMLLSMLWTPDRSQGWREVSGVRWAALLPLAWPALDRRRLLIGATAASFILFNAAQAMQAAGILRHPSPLVFGPDPDRVSAWTQPVVAGSLLTAALGLHLPAALMGGRARWERWAGLAGVAITGAAIAATGSRGAWLAAAVLVVIAVAAAVVRAMVAEKGRGRLLAPAVAAAALAGGAAVAWATMGDSIQRRFDAGVREVSAAIKSRDFSTDTGKRVEMSLLALEAFTENPLRGVGAGGYRAWALEHLRRAGEDPAGHDVRAHAHSAPLHVAATLGLVGLAIGGLILLVPIVVEMARPVLVSERPGYDAGPGYALLGLALAGATDAIHINTQTSALLFWLVLLCMPRRPGGTAPPPDRPFARPGGAA
jgi:hypothetical protein